MAETYRLRLYADDGTTVAAEFSTDPAHAHPDLRIPENLAGQSIDLTRGAATIGGGSIEIVDVTTDPADQDTGYFTSLLASANGHSARIGRRAHLEVLIGAAYENVINGVIDDIELNEGFSSYVLTLKDQRENERKTRAFVRNTTATVLPRGVLNGFGLNPDSGTYLVNPTEPLTARYTDMVSGTVGLLEFPEPGLSFMFWGRPMPVIERVFTAKMKKAWTPNADGIYDNIRLLWRVPGPGAYTEVRGLVAHKGVRPRGELRPGIIRVSQEGAESEVEVQYIHSFIFVWPSGASKPTTGTDIELIFAADGEPTADYPLHLQGMTFGDLLADLYDGVYSDPGSGPVVLYDPATVALLNEPVLARIKKPLDDDDGIWKWVEENIYAPTATAPALDAAGLVSPIKLTLPTGTPTVQLDDTNCEPIPGWSHTGTDAINVVSVDYPRFIAVRHYTDPNGVREGVAGDGLIEVTVNKQIWNAPSIALLGERVAEIKAVTLGAIGGLEDEPVSGDATDERGAQIAELRANEIMDRFLYGGQHFRVRALRSVLGSTRVGDWCLGSCSWWPDYVTGERGPGRLLQITSLTPLDTTWSEVELVDAGPDATPIGLPTLGALSVDAEGAVVIPVTAVPAGGYARADYAIAVSAPAATSGDWRFAGRVSAPGNITTPPNPSNVTVWVRARGEAEARRPSAWTSAVSIAVPSAPRLRNVRLQIFRGTGGVIVRWEPNLEALGIRIYYSIHEQFTVPPLTTTVDVNAANLSEDWPANTVPEGFRFTAELEPWTGWTGAAVSGTAGARRQVSAVHERVAEIGQAASPVVQLTEPVANVLGISIARVRNTEFWHSYEKLGGWPTLEATSSGTLDPAHLRQQNIPGTTRYIEHAANDGVWHVIIVPYNAKGEPGGRGTASFTIAGTPAGAGLITGVRAFQVLPVGVVNLLWTHNAAIDGSDRYTVDVYRDEVLKVSARPARMDYTGTSPGTLLEGGWGDSETSLCDTVDCIGRTLEYRIVLHDTTAVFPDREYSISYTGLVSI